MLPRDCSKTLLLAPSRATWTPLQLPGFETSSRIQQVATSRPKRPSAVHGGLAAEIHHRCHHVDKPHAAKTRRRPGGVAPFSRQELRPSTWRWRVGQPRPRPAPAAHHRAAEA